MERISKKEISGGNEESLPHDSSQLPENSLERLIYNFEEYKLSRTSGNLEIVFGEVPKVALEKPNQRMILHIENLIESLKVVDIDQNIYFYSSDLSKGIYKQEQLEKMQNSEINSMFLFQCDRHFFSIFDLCLRPHPNSSNFPNFNDVPFIKKCIFNLKKDLAELQPYHTTYPSVVPQKNWINTRLSENKVREILRLRNTLKMPFKNISRIVGTSRFTATRIVKEADNLGAPLAVRTSGPPKNLVINQNIIDSIDLFVKVNHGKINVKSVESFLKDRFKISVSRTTIYRVLKEKLQLRKRIGGTLILWKNSNKQKLSKYQYMIKYFELFEAGYVPVSVDEMGVQMSELHKFIWIKRGNRCPKSHPQSQERLNCIFAIALDSHVFAEFHTGSTGQVIFLGFLEFLLKRLEKMKIENHKKYFIILDNLPAHKTQILRALMTTYQTPILFLPPYSSNLQPVEYMNQWVKKMLNQNPSVQTYFYNISSNLNFL